MFLIIIFHFILGDSLSLKTNVQSANNQFRLRAFSDNRVILIEKESSTLFSIRFDQKEIINFSYEIILDPISDLQISYDKTIQIITQFNPAIIRFDRFLNVLDVHRLPISITEAGSFFELKSGGYLILSKSQKKLYYYKKGNQSIVEEIESGSYATLQFNQPTRLISYNNGFAVVDDGVLHLFNMIPNYIKSIKVEAAILNNESQNDNNIELLSSGKLYLNKKLIDSDVVTATLSNSYLFYLTTSMNLVRFEVN